MMHNDASLPLFCLDNGSCLTYGDIVGALYAVDADKCEVLLVHTEISFGRINPELRRNDLLRLLYDALNEMKVKTMVFPSFSFSFSNHEVFDIKKTKGRMGALNEYIRKLPGTVRTLEPQMSFVIVGDNKDIGRINGRHSLGTGSVFDNLHNTENVRILFFGPELSQCFTHMHYVEEQLAVPYRYNKDFSGTIIDDNGNVYEDTYTLFVKYKNVIPDVPATFDNYLIKNGFLKKVKLGNASIQCFTEKDAYNETAKWLRNDINGFLAEPYDKYPLVKGYNYGNVTTVQ